MYGLDYVFGSGLAFFLGVGLILFGLVASLGQSRVWQSLSMAAALFGLAVIALCGTPFSPWFYGLATLLTSVWLVAARNRTSVPRSRKIALCLSVALVWIGGAVQELRYQFLPSVPAVATRRLYLFGDSLSAGLSEDKASNWPQLLAGSHDLNLSDYSRAGATVAVAARHAGEAELNDGLVLLEIGGNDLLFSLVGKTPARSFDEDLEQLLKCVCQPGRQVVMFELPIPPLHNAFGRAQRRLAAKYGVVLIPKRVLMGVLAGEGNTLDSIHLSPQGHRQMAQRIWQVIQPAFDRD
jgi:acyl-CoA thioesterase I